MLYKKYSLYNNRIEIMLPSEFQQLENQIQTGQCAWSYAQESVRVDFSTRVKLDKEQSMSLRLQEHYLFYKREMEGFACKHIIKKEILGKEYGEMVFSSRQLGYGFYHVLLIGQLEEEEFLLLLQCMESQKAKMEHVFSIILDSVRINSDATTKGRDLQC